MSYQCVRAVLDSRLPASRKLTLVALAERATADGSEMFAPIRDLVLDTSKRPRTVKEDLAWLDKMGIIAEITGRRIHGEDREHVGGRSRCPHYRLNTLALATYHPDGPKSQTGRHDPADLASTAEPTAMKPCGQPHCFEAEKPCGPPHGFDTAVADSTAEKQCGPAYETVRSTAQTVRPTAPDPLDPSDPKKKNAPAALPTPVLNNDDTAEDAIAELQRVKGRIFGGRLAEADNGTPAENVSVLAALVRKELLSLRLADDVLIEETKLHAARFGIPYNSAAVERAIASARGQIRNGTSAHAFQDPG